MNHCCESCTMQCAPPCLTPKVPKLESLLCPQVCSCDKEQVHEGDRNYLLQRQKYPFSSLNSLGVPIGLVKTPCLKISDSGSDLYSLRFATYLKAFTYLFLSPEYEWNTEVLNLILKEGQKLFADSKKAEQQKKKEYEEREEKEEGLVKDPPPLSSNYSEIESRVKRSFELLGSFFDVELGDQFELNKNVSENIDDVGAPTLNVANLKAALKAYFKKKNYSLIEINNWYAMLWKANGVYFVLDICGRRLDTLETDKDGESFAVLMCLKRLENVYYLIASLSANKANDSCKLREIKVVRMGGPYGVFQLPEYGIRENEFVVVSPDYAYLTSALHLTLKTQYPLRTRSALPVGVAAIIASKIDHPATWTENVLNKIICYGVNVCRFCWEQCLQNSETIDFNCFPNQFRMGQFLISFELSPMQYTGTWRCIPNYQNTELALTIRKYFNEGINNLLIQINQQIYPVWKKNEFIYLLDPYRHKVMSVNFDGPRSATLRIFRTLDVFLFVFNYLLLQSNRKSNFYIHTLLIKKIELLKKKEGISMVQEATADESEVRSLNETICFLEDDKLCLDELGQPSDDEEEDSLEEEEVPESEPEPENAEEEGGEGGAMEDIANIESSSEDGGIDDRRRNRSKGVDSGKRRKGGDKKKKNKRDMSERIKKPKDSVKDSTTAEPDSNKMDKMDKNTTESMKDITKTKTDNKGSMKADQIEKQDAKENDFKKFGEEKDGSKDDSKDVIQLRKNLGRSSDNGTDNGNESKKFEDESDQTKPKANNYPGYSLAAHDIAVAASETGSYDSICKLLRAGFRCADRILVITPFGSFVVFCCKALCKKMYFIFDGCTCNINKFKHMDIHCGTEGLMSFKNLHEAINYMIDTRKIRSNLAKSRKNLVDEIFHKFCPQDPDITCSLHVSKRNRTCS